MDKRLKTFGIVTGILASALCLLAGIWVLSIVGFETSKDNAISTGIGIYFIGKAFFVGPLLIITSLKRGKEA